MIARIGELDVYVVDSWMGSGKSQGIITQIKEHPEKRYLIFVELLSEGKRYKEQCTNIDFYEPLIDKTDNPYDTKTAEFEKLLHEGKNIISTHALAESLDLSDKLLNEMIDYKYTVIIDEAMEIIRPIAFAEDDIHDAITTAHISIGKNNIVRWIDDDYVGDRCFLKSMAKSNSLYLVEKNKNIKKDKDSFIWIMSPNIFAAAEEVYVLTYNFEDSYMKYYFDMHGIKYSLMHAIDGKFFDGPEDRTAKKMEASRLLHIADHRINNIGNSRTALSKSWYTKHASEREIIYNNTYNFLKNITKSTVDEAAYSIFKDYSQPEQLKRYWNGFIPTNCRGTNMYSHKTNFAVLTNIYMHPMIRNFFERTGDVQINEDGFARNQLLQLIWRSAIRNGKDVNLYLPSARMRRLLTDYLQTA